MREVSTHTELLVQLQLDWSARKITPKLSHLLSSCSWPGQSSSELSPQSAYWCVCVCVLGTGERKMVKWPLPEDRRKGWREPMGANPEPLLSFGGVDCTSECLDREDTCLYSQSWSEKAGVGRPTGGGSGAQGLDLQSQVCLQPF